MESINRQMFERRKTALARAAEAAAIENTTENSPGIAPP